MARYGLIPQMILQNMDRKQMVSEYRRLRKNIKGRVETFKKHGVTKEKSSFLEDFDRNFKSASEMTERDLAYTITRLTDALSEQTSTYKGYLEYRKKRIDVLQKDFNWLNDSNFDAFTKIMEELRDIFANAIFDSEQALTDISNMIESGMGLETAFSNYIKGEVESIERHKIHD